MDLQERPQDTSCCGKCGHEMRELFCKPKARCFKGLMILSGIYTLACGLMLLIIPPVVNAHGYTDESVGDNLHLMTVMTGVIMVVFAGASIINFICFGIYSKREGRRESIINGDLMNRQGQNDFVDDDGFEERH